MSHSELNSSLVIDPCGELITQIPDIFQSGKCFQALSLIEALQTAFPRLCRSASLISKAFWHVFLDEFRSMKDLLILPLVQSLLLT